VFLTGYTGCGKSTLGVWLLSRCPPLRVIIDPSGSAVTDIPGVWSTADPTATTWPDEAHTVRFVPERSLDLAAYDRIYRALGDGLKAGRWPHVTVLCDEAESVMPANRCPPEASQFVFAGRKWGTGHIACSTRPYNVAVALKSNLSAAALFVLPERRDRETIAGNLGIPLAQLEELWKALPPQSKSFLWWEQETRSIRPVHSYPR
jgi:hypothetical protein